MKLSVIACYNNRLVMFVGHCTIKAIPGLEMIAALSTTISLSYLTIALGHDCMRHKAEWAINGELLLAPWPRTIS